MIMSDAKKVNFEIKTSAAKKVVAVKDPFLAVDRKKSLNSAGSVSKPKSSKKLDASKNIDHLEQ